MFAPIEDELLTAQGIQQIFRDLFHLFPLCPRQFQVGTGQQIKDGQLFLGQVFRDAALLFLVQTLREGDELGEEGIQVFDPGVVVRDHLLELLVVVHAAAVQAHHAGQLGVDLAAQLFDFNVFVPALELLLEFLEVNLAQIYPVIGPLPPLR